MEYSLRPTRDDDVELLQRVYSSTREEELAAVPWTAEEKEAFLRMQFTAQDTHYRAHYKGAAFDVILVNDEPAGRLYVYRTPRELCVMDIALLPELRRRGLGERIFRDLFAEADRDGKRVTIYVEVQNVARRLYDRLGFRVVDEGDPSPVYLLMER